MSSLATPPSTPVEVPHGLKGVIVADTEIGDVRGGEGFYHYRQYSAVDLAETRPLEDVWRLLIDGALPATHAQRAAFADELRPLRTIPAGLAAALPVIAQASEPLNGLRTAVPPRDDLDYAANYLWMLTGEPPTSEHADAIKHYLVSTIDHGFNASTFTSRVIASTGADMGACIVGAIAALSGPLHGGAPSRALDLLDEIATPDRARPIVTDKVLGGERIMGFGHAVYTTQDPRSMMLKRVAERLGGPLVDLATQIEDTIVDVLAELKPGRHLYANVEFYASVVMSLCGIPPEMFTPTFAASRVIGWTANVLEQAHDTKIIRPSARYVGPSPPQPVPPLP